MSDNESENNDDLHEDIEGVISDPDGAAASAKDAAAGAADSAKDLLGGAKDKLPDNPLSGKGAAAAAGAAGLAGSLKGKAGDLLGGGGDAASSLKDKAAAAKANLGDAASGATDKLSGNAPDVDVPDVDAPDLKGKGASLKDRAAAAKANMADAAGSMKDKAAGAADSAKGAAAGATDGVKGAAAGVTGAAAGATGAAAGAAGSMKDKAVGAVDSAKDAAAGAADSAKGAAAGATDGVKGAAAGVTGAATGAVGGATDGVKGAATAATAGVAGAAASASDKVSAATSSVTETATSAAASVSGGPVDAVRSGGSGDGGSGSGSSGGGGRDDDDDDEAIIPGLPISGEWQIIGLGLLVASFFLFGSTIWGWISGGDDLGVGDAVESVAVDPLCEDVWSELRSSDLDPDSYDGLSCEVRGGEAFITGEVASPGQRTAIAAVIAGASAEAGSRLTLPSVDEPEVDEVEEVAAEVTTTTAAPETTTTTAAPETTTTTEAETTTTTTEAPAPEPTNMWDALGESGQAGQFMAIGGALGLQDSLEGTEPAQRTLFAPSDEALAKLDPATINAIASDPARANALVGYHFLPDALTAEDVVALDGTTVDSLTGLPMAFSVVDGEVFINENTKIVATDYTSDNGIVHIIDTVLDPPSVNAVIGLENIEFEVNSDVITAAGQAELSKAVAYFTENATANSVIEGHTDTDGADADNLDLSERRAEAVKAFLVSNGIAEDRLTTQGFGETQPILVDGVEDKAASRRIEFNLR